ncbi:MAG: hypothetical protein KAI18_03270, partial [Candidatus Aenigmarchaeota archaeon]|nr:hypothetical protein [Candidatus Aenigmarchaeota archaeon]
MVRTDNRKLIMGIGIIISFALLMMSISIYFNFQHDLREQSRLDPDQIDDMTTDEIKRYMIDQRAEQPVFHSYYLLPFMGFIGLLVGTLVYYIMSDKVVQQEHTLKNNSKIILNFLTGSEKKVIETLLENDGKVQQYELSHLPNLNKVKTHRILLNLEQKKIIHKERLGKINK